MYELFWKALFVSGLITTAVAFWGPEPEITVYTAVMNIGLWTVLAFGSTNLLVYSGGTAQTVGSNVVAYLFGFNAFLSIIPLLVGLVEWTDDETDDNDTNSLQQQVPNP